MGLPQSPRAAAESAMRSWPWVQFVIAGLIGACLLTIVFTFLFKIIKQEWSPSRCERPAPAVALSTSGPQDLRVPSITGPAPLETTSPAAMTGTPAPWHQGREPEPAKADNGDQMDAIANTMTALGAAVGVITLILTIGTTWFADQQKQLNEQIAVVKHQVDRQVKREQIEHLRDKARDQLAQAKHEAIVWITGNTNPINLAVWQRNIDINLEMLLSGDRSLRKKALLELNYVLGDGRSELPHVEAYTLACHELHKQQACHRATPVDGTSPDVRQAADEVDAGLACKVFDEGEIQRVRGPA